MKLKKVNKVKELSVKQAKLIMIGVLFLVVVTVSVLATLSYVQDGNEKCRQILQSAEELDLIHRSAQMGDLVIVDFKGKIGDDYFENGSAENATIALGSSQMIPGFEKGIVGHEVGETFTIDVTFPKQYAEDVAGKDAVFEITIKELWRNIATMHE